LFFFEISLIPILTIILGWGSTPERLTAGSYLIIYTLIFSVPFFFLLIFLYYKKERFSFGLYNPICKFSEIFSIDWILIFWLLSFLVKVPMYGLHLWLAKAHVEAPVFGSMLLAAILLKLGLYGLIRSYYFWNFKKLILKKFFRIFLFFGLVCSGLVCFRQIDIKSLIAYSSVQHMMLGLISLNTFSFFNFKGILFMSIFHGFVSSALFFGFKIIYKITNSRKILLNFGFLKIFPLFILLWFICLSLNSGLPPFGNFISEILLIISIREFFIFGFPFIIVGVFLSGLFSIFLYSMVSHGNKKIIFKKNLIINLNNLKILAFQCIPPLFGLFFIQKFL